MVRFIGDSVCFDLVENAFIGVKHFAGGIESCSED